MVVAWYSLDSLSLRPTLNLANLEPRTPKTIRSSYPIKVQPTKKYSQRISLLYIYLIYYLPILTHGAEAWTCRDTGQHKQYRWSSYRVLLKTEKRWNPKPRPEIINTARNVGEIKDRLVSVDGDQR
jgi:hypothetical protein